jgi:hypothetical protein
MLSRALLGLTLALLLLGLVGCGGEPTQPSGDPIPAVKDKSRPGGGKLPKPV